ncbi:MAG: hypothetical protein JO062_13055 [Bryobacterales bacterium]|nr:hypothetical protein [Bryobacterales bacterium]
MTTNLKSKTARQNGARSKGPVTPEGKAASSQNSIRHGMLSQTVVLEGESKDLFEQLLTSITTEIQPRTPIETGLVERMAIAHWRQMRTWAVQKASLDVEMARPENTSGSKPARFAGVFKSLSDNSNLLNLVNCYESSFERSYYRALSYLMKLRESPATQAPDPNLLPLLTCAHATWTPDEVGLPNEPTPEQPS